ncbi:MAG: methyltransferase domain-containing protein [Gammaproteobacteria bacterium]|nr:methyltransferase domain-containing protein [Gammaproteobacteria bacterium]
MRLLNASSGRRGSLARGELLLWLRSPRGRRQSTLEQRELQRVLPELFGRHILQVGSWDSGRRLLAHAEMLHRAVLGTVSGLGAQGVVLPEALPIANKSVDAVVLPHTLEFAASPHHVLREVDRILTDRGRLVILGFNPWSLWGIRRHFGLSYRALPCSARFATVNRLVDWLQLLNFEITQIRRFGSGFPWTVPRSHGDPLTPGALLAPFADSYLLVAKKRVIPMTLIGRPQRAQVVRPLIGGAVGLPGVRSEQP